MSFLVRVVALLSILIDGAAAANAQFAPGFDKAAAEAAFPAASQQHNVNLTDLYGMRGLPPPSMRTATVAEVAGFLERKDDAAPYPAKTAILFYALKNGQLSAWLIDRSGLKAASRAPMTAEQLDTAIRNLRLSLNVDGISRSRAPRLRAAKDERLEGRNFLEKDVVALSTMLLPKPIADGLKGTEHLLVVANGAIATVPLAILKLDKKTMLIDRATISVSPGLFDVDQMIRPWDSKTTLAGALIVGNPKVAASPVWDVPDLPGAEEEARGFAAIANRPALIGAAARKDAVLLQLAGARLLYFAAHGVSNPAEPLTGGFLMLSGDDSESGFLRAAEIQRRRLNAALVVLSACQSGLGLVHDGGVIGLSRSFQKAGAPRVVMSLWSVSDEATVALMSSFQHHLTTDVPAVALRKAMLETRRNFPEPALWAPFVLFGTPR